MLDAHPVLMLLENEPSSERIRGILEASEVWITLINLGEVIYMTEKIHGVERADEVFATLREQEVPGTSVAIRSVEIDNRLLRAAAKLKAQGGMSYADCFAAAAAQLLDCPVLTGDGEFRAAERAGIAVEWV